MLDYALVTIYRNNYLHIWQENNYIICKHFIIKAKVMSEFLKKLKITEIAANKRTTKPINTVYVYKYFFKNRGRITTLSPTPTIFFHF